MRFHSNKPTADGNCHLSLSLSGPKTNNLAMSTSSFSVFVSGDKAGVSQYQLNADGHLLKRGSTKPSDFKGNNPTWIEFPNQLFNGQRLLYVSDEIEKGRVYVLKMDSNGNLSKLGGDDDQGTFTGGNGPVSLAFTNHDQQLFVANYDSASVTVFQVNPHNGSLVSPAVKTFQFHRDSVKSSVTNRRQDRSYPHQVVLGPQGKFVYVPDLGADRIHRISINQSKVVGTTIVADGSGPRHLVFYTHPSSETTTTTTTTKSYAYLVSELANTVTTFSVDSQTGDLKVIGSPIPVSPPSTTTTETNQDRTAAEIVVSPDGRFLYISNRGDPIQDHISIFSIDSQTGSLKFLEWIESGGKMPRHFSISPKGTWLVVGHQVDGNVVVFKRNYQTGKIVKVSQVFIENVDGQVAFAGFAPLTY